MSTIGRLLEQAKAASHPHCTACPWNPGQVGGMAFGTSCPTHSCLVDGRAAIVSVAQDPGGTTPEHTSRLCPVCNSENVSDQSAQHGFDLWRAAISLQPRRKPYEDAVMKRTYFTNAVMHGIPRNDSRSVEARKSLESNWKDAVRHCAGMLHEQLQVLQPRIVMLSGKIARDAVDLFAAGRWSPQTAAAPPRKTARISGVPAPVELFHLIHASARGTNQVAAKLAKKWFASTDEQRSFIEKQIATLPSPDEALRLLDSYRWKSETTFRGMMTHLAWWIEVGKDVRQVVRPD